MRRFALFLLLPLLAACGSSAEDDFSGYEISGIEGKYCTYDEQASEVVTTLRIKGFAEGRQTVKAKVTVENTAGKVAADGTGEAEVEGQYRQELEVRVPLAKRDWDAGFTECFFSSAN